MNTLKLFRKTLYLSIISVLCLYPLKASAADLDIDSDAPSYVFINEKLAGETPLTILDISAGSYKLEIKRPGYQSYSRNITIMSSRGKNQNIKINAVLKPGNSIAQENPQVINHYETVIVQDSDNNYSRRPSRRTGQMTINSYPRGARVYMDGDFIGYTPIEVSGRAGRSHQIIIKNSGYRDHVSTITIPYNSDGNMTATLRRLYSHNTGTYYDDNTSYYDNGYSSSTTTNSTTTSSDPKKNLRNVLFGAALINEAFTGKSKEKNRNRNSILGGMLLNEIFGKGD